jgi:hypothetical protein
MLNTPHQIIIEIAPDGKIKGEVVGVEGQSCQPLSAWLDELGKVETDSPTPDFYKEGVRINLIKL